MSEASLSLPTTSDDPDDFDDLTIAGDVLRVTGKWGMLFRLLAAPIAALFIVQDAVAHDPGLDGLGMLIGGLILALLPFYRDFLFDRRGTWCRQVRWFGLVVWSTTGPLDDVEGVVVVHDHRPTRHGWIAQGFVRVGFRGRRSFTVQGKAVPYYRGEEVAAESRRFAERIADFLGVAVVE